MADFSGRLLTDFLDSHPVLCVEPDGAIRTGLRPAALLSGSFNPLHDGHRQLAEAAGRRLQAPVAFELSVLNADKPEVAADELLRRVQQFLTWGTVYLTRAWRFEDKAALFPGTVFVGGADTAARVLDSRYYGNDPAARDRSLQTIRQHGCRFLVGGRAHASGPFVTLASLGIPEAWQDLFEGMSEAEFRVDLSSTEMRLRRPGATATWQFGHG